MVQGVFDDLNPKTRSMFDYPDGPFDAERNTDELVAAMPSWRRAGLLAFTLNLQGGSPQGYSSEQPWHNSAFAADGRLRPDYAARTGRIIERADELGMVVILGCFYFGQDRRLSDEAAVVAAAKNATEWILGAGCTNVIVEIANEIDVPRYTHQILKPDRGHELIELVQQASAGRVGNRAGRLLVGTSYRGGSIPRPNVVGAADVLFLHGNHIDDPAEIRLMVRETRAVPLLSGPADPVQRGRPFRFRAGRQQFHGRDRRGRQLGAVRLPPAGGGPGMRLPERARGLAHQRAAQARLLQPGRRDDRQPGALLKAHGTIVVNQVNGENHEMDGALQDGCSTRTEG
jgi:hypothetical protein